jgi:chemotaxis protein MotB
VIVPPPPKDEDREEWLITYADAITLLMAFFIMLASFSKVDIATFEKVAAGIAGEIGHREQETPVDRLKVDMQDIIYGMDAEKIAKISTDEKGVVIELDSSAFFKSGSADLRDEILPVLQRTFQVLMAPGYSNFMVEVEGHTDDDPISTDKFPSNWELSAGRASAVVRYFQTQGMPGRRLEAIGYGDTRPKVPNRDANGVPIPENQAQNRRVVLRAYPVFRKDIEIPTFRHSDLQPASMPDRENELLIDLEEVTRDVRAPTTDTASDKSGAAKSDIKPASGPEDGTAPPPEDAE